jgi:hypothetical protein
MPSNQTFAEKVLDKINLLNTTGKNYRRVNHKLLDIIQYYIEHMQKKYNHIGTNYVNKMTTNIQTIFTKIFEKNKTELTYDTLEFVNNIIDWYFKCLAFKYNLTKIQPQIPDYIISEINDIAKSM